LNSDYAPHNQTPSTTAPARESDHRRSPHAHHPWPRWFRRLLIVAASAFVLATIAGGWYAWTLVGAIEQAEEQAVVELPTRVPRPDSRAVGTPGDRSSGEVASAPRSASQPSSVDAEQGDTSGPSRFDVARGLVTAGTGAGNPTVEEVWPDKSEVTILVLGVDRRVDGGDQNADVIILARLDLERQTVATVSLPRDLLVEIPGVGMDKISSAYNYGVERDRSNKAAGVGLVRDTVEHNFDILIDDYVMVDFQGFERVVDALGGVEIDVPEEIDDPNYPTDDYGTRHLHFDAGLQHMNGEEALAYARTRHGDNDDARRDRQTQVLLALFDKGKGLGSLTRASEMIVALGGAVQTSFHFDEQLALARLGFNVDRGRIEMASVSPPLIEPGTTEGGAWVYVGDLPAIAAFIEEALTGNAPGTPTG
jgi:polyisoprenyl-teichoic acid--peptidoglycan teichoic acid transferase